MKVIMLFVVYVLLVAVLSIGASALPVAAPAPPRFWVSDMAMASDGRTAYLLHDRTAPRFCMLVLETMTGTVWTPRNCE